MGEEFAIGSRVSARGLAWDVSDIMPLGGQTLLRLRCAGGDLAGLEWDVLHPAEPVELLRAQLRPDAPGPLAAWRLHHQASLLEQVLGMADRGGRVGLNSVSVPIDGFPANYPPRLPLWGVA
jgi:hypothetical protein